MWEGDEAQWGVQLQEPDAQIVLGTKSSLPESEFY